MSAETKVAKKSPITTHVLDTSLGRPAAGVPVTLEQRGEDGSFAVIGKGSTDDDGRTTNLLEPGSVKVGIYRINFDLDPYFSKSERESFYPHASIVFRVKAPSEHYHVPLLLNPYGYSTYRGS